MSITLCTFCRNTRIHLGFWKLWFVPNVQQISHQFVSFGFIWVNDTSSTKKSDQLWVLKLSSTESSQFNSIVWTTWFYYDFSTMTFSLLDSIMISSQLNSIELNCNFFSVHNWLDYDFSTQLWLFLNSTQFDSTMTSFQPNTTMTSQLNSIITSRFNSTDLSTQHNYDFSTQL